MNCSLWFFCTNTCPCYSCSPRPRRPPRSMYAAVSPYSPGCCHNSPLPRAVFSPPSNFQSSDRSVTYSALLPLAVWASLTDLGVPLSAYAAVWKKRHRPESSQIEKRAAYAYHLHSFASVILPPSARKGILIGTAIYLTEAAKILLNLIMFFLWCQAYSSIMQFAAVGAENADTAFLPAGAVPGVRGGLRHRRNCALHHAAPDQKISAFRFSQKAGRTAPDVSLTPP